MSNTDRPTILFVCTHNSARSQMAEGLLRSRHGSRYRTDSAGTQPGSVHPLAIAVMAEVGIDITLQQPKHVDTLSHINPEYVLTVCDSAYASCPAFPADVRTIHRNFPDPSRTTGSSEDRLEAFRQVRDQMAAWIDELFGVS